MGWSVFVAASAATIVIGAMAVPAAAQGTQPFIDHILPAGGQRGQTVTVMVRGRYLTGATHARVSGSGVSGKVVSVEQPDAGKQGPRRLDAANNPDLAKVEVVIAPDAPVGEREFRIISPGGASNRMRFYVGEIPETLEQEPNSSFAQAQDIGTLPMTVNGQAFQADRDFFAFNAKAGQTLVFDAWAQRIRPYIADGVPGWFQASLTLYDADGREVAYIDDFRHHPDPILVYQVPRDGRYVVEIKDTLFRGRDDFVYRLRMGELPLITHVFPLGGKRGTKLDLMLFGVNLPGDRLSLELTNEDPSRRWVSVVHNGVAANQMPLAVDDLAESLEHEPNNTPAEAQKIDTPIVINARIDKPGDVDYYRLTAAAGATMVIQTVARRLDSPIDTIVTVFNAQGVQLAQNDDFKDDTEGLITHHSDSLVTYKFPAAGEYLVSVAEVQGRGGPEFAYRLRIAPPQPDFVLRFKPDNARAAQGGAALFTVTAFRRDGFEGPISLSLSGLPPGFQSPDAEIPAKERETRMIVNAPTDAPMEQFTLQIVGKAVIGDVEVVRRADPAEDQLQAFYYNHNVPCQEAVLSVVPAGPFMITAEMPEKGYFEVPQRGELQIPLKVVFNKEEVRQGQITLRADRLLRGINLKIDPLEPGKTETVVTITTIGNDVYVGQTGAVVLAASMRLGKDTITGFAPALPFKIVPNKPQ